MLDRFATRATKDTLPIDVVDARRLDAWKKGQPEAVRRWVEAAGFRGDPGTALLIPGADGSAGVGGVLFAVPRPGADGGRGPFRFSPLPALLPPGRYRFADDALPEAEDARDAALGWALAGYDFDRYRRRRRPGKNGAPAPVLVWPEAADRGEVTRLAEGTALCRDLINIPAGDLPPDALAQATRDLGKKHGAKVSVIRGEKLLTANYPAVHAVGRASVHPPCLIDLRWGEANHPRVTLVGKGVVFDSGGLDLKPAGGMLLMKKDMGGAAHVLGLAHAVMDAGLPVRLRVLIPAVENAVSGNAFHPLDVLQTRKGITIEVGNTDAEGRLILCDALAEADAESPDMILDFATLTGAARIALGTELPALFASDDELAAALLQGGEAQEDPFWRMPLHRPYRRLLDSRVADLSNVSPGRFGGAITAALFLQEFVSSKTPWAHVDVMAWNLEHRPGRPQGGEAMGLRAAYAALRARYADGRRKRRSPPAATKKKAAAGKARGKKASRRKTPARPQ